VCVCMYVRTYLFMYVCTYVCICVCMYVCMCVNVYMFIRMYVCMYVYIYLRYQVTNSHLFCTALYCYLWPVSLHIFSITSLKVWLSGKKYWTQNVCFDFLNKFVWNISYPRRMRRGIIIALHTVKGKAVPLQARSGPEGSRKLRFPDFTTTAQDGGKVVSPTHRPPLPPGNAPGTHFC